MYALSMFGSLFIVLLVVLFLLGINKLLDTYLRKISPQEKGSRFPPDIYDIDNVIIKRSYPIIINGEVRQKFSVDQIASPFFFIKVIIYARDAHGKRFASSYFDGWTEELLSDQMITPESLLQNIH